MLEDVVDVRAARRRVGQVEIPLRVGGPDDPEVVAPRARDDEEQALLGLGDQTGVGVDPVLLALIGPRWLARSGRLGRRRLDDPKDFVRLEIAAALERGITVVPVLVQDARMPTSLQLPNPLVGLADIQASELSDRRWGADVRRLIGTLERLSLASSRGPERHAAPGHAPREAQTPKSAPPMPLAPESDRRPPTVVSAAEIESRRIDRVPAGAEDISSPGGAIDRLRPTSKLGR